MILVILYLLMAEVKRSYSSPRRAEQARRTRQSILDAAGRLFVETGYGSTTLQQIADLADVSVQTVYSSFGNKPAVLGELLDVSIAGDDEPVAVNDRDWMKVVFNDPDPVVRLKAYAAAVAGIHDRAGDIFHALQAAAHTDAALVPLAQETEGRRRTGAATVVEGLAGIGALAPGLDEVRATDILSTLTSPDHYRRLVAVRRWPLADYETWLAVTMTRTLIRSDGPEPNWHLVGS